MDNNTPSPPSTLGSSSTAERLTHGATPQQTASQLNGSTSSGPRRPQTLMSPVDRKLMPSSQNLTLTIHKYSNGYGMKVSGDNPVYVESVKSGGAAQSAGLLEGDMILKVNGNNVRSSTHTNVVELIKSSSTVELTVQRNYNKMQRPSSVSGGVGPTTPLAQRGGITGPKPVDSATSHEMKLSKIQTLRLYLDKEKKNLENLTTTNGNRQDILRAEQTIRTLQEQLKLLCGDDANLHLFSAIPSPIAILQQTPQPPPPSTPAFLSRFPRSLSSLSLGTKKKSNDKTEIPLPPPQSSQITASNAAPPSISSMPIGFPSMNSSYNMELLTPLPSHMVSAPNNQMISTPSKKKICNSSSQRDLKRLCDIPPPLPQRNIPRKLPSSNDVVSGVDTFSSGDTVILRRNHQVSDLDCSRPHSSSSGSSTTGSCGPITGNNNTGIPSPNRNSPQSAVCGGGGGNGGGSGNGKGPKQRQKQKIKALSDPKMSSQMLIDMEQTLPGDATPLTMGHGTGNIGKFHMHHNINSGEAPPLPPRQPGMLEEKQNFLNNSNASNSNGGVGSGGGCGGSGNGKFGTNGGRPLPNSLETHMNYPLIATCTAVRDNISAFPLSHRPNIVQHLQHQQQQQQQHNYNNHHQNHHHLNTSPSTCPTATTTSTKINKSTALGLTLDQLNQLNNAQTRRVISSPEHFHPELPDQLEKSFSHWETFEKIGDDTIARPPPGTPPPFYDDSMTDSIFETSSPVNNSTINNNNNNNNNSHNISNSSTGANMSQQRQIISMEDDEMPDDQESISEDHGPFRSLHQLLEHENLAYLAVFLNFVLSNSNPSPLLFYLITSLYKEGTVKDMRKWAYEIHSTFLVPRAPLLWCDVDENMLREVDDVLQNEYNKVEILRKLFWSSRRKAKEHINQQLNEFQVKRTAGLGTMYGPSDQHLMEAQGDKVKEQKVFEETLLPKLQQLVDELDKETPNECPKKSALSSALSTVLHRIFVTRPNPGSPIDRVHHFVSREKSFKSRLMGKNRKQLVRGHHLVLRQYYEVAHCNHCQNIIWGVSPQGFHCTDCELNIHRACSKVLEENCPGPASSKQKSQHTDNKMSKFIEKIRPTHYFIQAERSRRQDEDISIDESVPIERPLSTTVVRQPSDRRPETNLNSISGQNPSDFVQLQQISGGVVSGSVNNSGIGVGCGSNSGGSDLQGLIVPGDGEMEIRDSSKSKSAPVSVNRSESYKERLSHRRNRNNRRKTSDPSLSKTNDEHAEIGGISNANFTASSSSSLSSSSLDSPSTSLEVVGAHPIVHGAPVPREWVDSDDETGDLEADWSSNVASDILQTLSDGEKKRQEIINEIYQTERNHVRTLRLLEGIFMRPLQESGALSYDHFNLLFPPALLMLKEHHSSFEQQLKHRRCDQGPLIGEIGDLLLRMFDGQSGDELKEYAAQFCARQQIALEALKEKRRKDENLQRLLTKAESHKACRRLQLKDLLPTALQRLTKYPLLFESLQKITIRVLPDSISEAQAIQCALDASRRILDHVNQAVRISEDAHKLQTIQKKLDRSGYDKEATTEFRNLDLTQHRLMHEGLLIMKKNPGVQLHGLLFENMMVLLQKLDDKYVLKYHSSPSAGSGEGKIIEGRFNPITKVNLILVRLSAVDKNTFFLINTNVSQMLELSAPSSSECKAWFKHISDAAESYKFRTKSTQESAEDPAVATLPIPPPKETVDIHPTDNNKDLATTTILPSTTITDQSNVTNNNNNTSNINNNTSNNNNINQNNPSDSGDHLESITESNNNNFCKNAEDVDIKRRDQQHQTHHQQHVQNRDDHNDSDHDHHRIGDDDNISSGGNVCNDNKAQLNQNRKFEYSTNSNSTRTLTQQSSLVAPCEVQINHHSAALLTAEPVLTPCERLRRLDDLIRETLAEKQKIVCDMFRIPNEHFTAIADIIGQPEAPNEPSDIVLAAFAQIQSLTETLNDYIKVSAHQEISAVSTALCDECVKLNTTNSRAVLMANNENGDLITESIISECTETIPLDGITTTMNSTDTNSTNELDNDPSTLITDSSTSTTTVKTDIPNERNIFVPIVDDDGYCEIDEIRLPSLFFPTANSMITTSTTIASNLTPDLKRQSTISADSIPEETEHEVNVELFAEFNDCSSNINLEDPIDNISKLSVTNATTLATNDDNDEHIEINETYGTSCCNDDNAVVDVAEIIIPENISTIQTEFTSCIVNSFDECPINRLTHATSLAPAVPCHLISSHVSALSMQISQLLPKLCERDMEREKLRKENQHLRELLHSMHERMRVLNEVELPTHATESITLNTDTIG